MRPPPALNGRGLTVGGSLLVAAVALLGLAGVGRLAMEAWLDRPAPASLPEVGGTARSASPLLFVVLDGVREGAVFGPEASMPFLGSLAERGVGGVALAGDPTLTAPCVRALLTGRAPDIVTGFRNFNARPVEGSVVQYLVGRGARAAHAGDANIAQFCVRWLDPAHVLAFPDQGPTDQGQCDDRAVPFVLGKVADGFDLVTLHLTRPDHAGHRWGAVGPEYAAACRRTDAQVEAVTTAFLARHPSGTVLVAADHGVTPTGTHGGGEMAARRAPFVLAGPRVARLSGVEVSQFSLAPTLCALLGLPQPPLADAPPRPELLELTAMEEARALSAYVEARAAVARALGSERVDPIERRRAEVAVKRMAPERADDLLSLAADVNGLLVTSSLGHGTLALLVAALWLVTLVHLASAGPARGPAVPLATLFAAAAFPLALNQAPSAIPVGPVEAGALVVAACGLALGAARGAALRGLVTTLALLALVPVFTGGGLTMQAAFEAEAGAPVQGRAWAAVLFLAAVAVATARPGAAWRHGVARLVRAPGLLAALGGALLGFLLSVKPFLDPFVDVRLLVGLLAAGFVAWMVLSPAGRERSPGERVALALAAALVFLGTRAADLLAAPAASSASWIAATPKASGPWTLVGVAALLALLLALPLRRLARRDLPGVGLAALALALAYALRLHPEAGPWVTRGAVVGALAALGASFAAGTREGRLVVPSLAAAALARRLIDFDAEYATFLVFATGVAVAARWAPPRTRLGIGFLALGVLLARTSLFHALGGTESFSTIDVAAGFVGVRGDGPRAVDAAGGALVTPQVLEAGVQLALRFALPWLLLLAAAGHAFRDPAGMRRVAADLTVGFAARAAVIATALWAWWRSAWWMMHAYPVYALGAADVVLLTAALALGGGWARAPRPAGADVAPA